MKHNRIRRRGLLSDAAAKGGWDFAHNHYGFFSRNGLIAFKGEVEAFSVELDAMDRVFRWTRYDPRRIQGFDKLDYTAAVIEQSNPNDTGKFERAIAELERGPIADEILKQSKAFDELRAMEEELGMGD